MEHVSKGVAFVTGAAQGVGRAIALRLADDGYDMAINDITSSRESLDQLSHEILEKQHRKVCRVIGDVSIEREVEAMIECVVEDLGRLDVMVANAGLNLIKPMLESESAVSACFLYAGKQMIAQGTGGRIIGSSSVVGKQGEQNMSAYSSTKFAVRGLTQAAARELGHHNITVNAYAPGAIDTPLLQNLSGSRTHFYEEESKKAALGHIGKPVEVASLVSYLVSEEAHFITGKCLVFYLCRLSHSERCYLFNPGQSVSVNGGRFFD
ncbi:hypothetical protein H0H81_010905 [Sphagnurus paluster]|uniref:NAD(P)-binding protein n=1 Tax=Sphagnurus paluster TaxID=117069 RepID=A0A9P7FP32_9AGAR|nr:hypothetical protein H0H81_010905 [Sphagnurus paluster]